MRQQQQQQFSPYSFCMPGISLSIFSMILPQSTGKPVASMKKKVACQIAVNVLLSSATRSRKPVS
jgi:hypothetical protein